MTNRPSRSATRAAWLGLAAAVGAVAALAAPAPPRLFLSPSGEPFRLTPANPDPLKAWFDQAETKRQGFLDREEFRADAARFFKKLDANGDGVIDGFELQDYENKIVPELTQQIYGAPNPTPAGETRPSGRRGHRPGGGDQAQGEGKEARPRHPGRAIAQLINEPEPVAGADFNLDSHITLAEWMSATDQRFALLDADKSGRLTLEGLRGRLTGPVAPSQRRQQELRRTAD